MAERELESARFFSAVKFAASCIHFISAPAQKLGPSPRRITARTCGSSPNSRAVSRNSTTISALKALCTSGRFRLSETTPYLSIVILSVLCSMAFLHSEDAEPRLFNRRI